MELSQTGTGCRARVSPGVSEGECSVRGRSYQGENNKSSREEGHVVFVVFVVLVEGLPLVWIGGEGVERDDGEDRKRVRKKEKARGI